MKAMTVRLPDDLYESLRLDAFTHRMSITALIIEALEHRDDA